MDSSIGIRFNKPAALIFSSSDMIRFLAESFQFEKQNSARRHNFRAFESPRDQQGIIRNVALPVDSAIQLFEATRRHRQFLLVKIVSLSRPVWQTPRIVPRIAPRFSMDFCFGKPQSFRSADKNLPSIPSPPECSKTDKNWRICRRSHEKDFFKVSPFSDCIFEFGSVLATNCLPRFLRRQFQNALEKVLPRKHSALKIRPLATIKASLPKSIRLSRRYNLRRNGRIL